MTVPVLNSSGHCLLLTILSPDAINSLDKSYRQTRGDTHSACIGRVDGCFHRANCLPLVGMALMICYVDELAKWARINTQKIMYIEAFAAPRMRSEFYNNYWFFTTTTLSSLSFKQPWVFVSMCILSLSVALRRALCFGCATS